MKFTYLFLLGLIFSQECNWNYGIPGEHNKLSDQNTRRNMIVSGEAASAHEYPWQVSIEPIGCGGSIIAREWILTAAHCDTGTTTIVAGLGALRIPGTFVSHEEYGVPFSLFNDIALVKLDEPLPCDDPTVGAIGLYEKVPSFSIDGCSAWVTGFGALAYQGSSPFGYQMHELQTKIWDSDTCNAAPENIYDLPNSQICGFTPGNPNEDSCQGDSGGPFKIDVNADSVAFHEYVQAGIVSYGSGCGSTAGIYTDVSDYKDWVLGKVPTAKFVPVNSCDTEHYYEGIVDCEGDSCSLELPYCQNLPNWQSESGRVCSDYNSFSASYDCFADKGMGFFAHEVCRQCEYCTVGTDTEPTVVTNHVQTDCSGREELVQWEVQTNSWAKEISFSIGSSCSGIGFKDNTGYSGSCCLKPGDNEIVCVDEFGDGWHGATLTVGGELKCGSFEAKSSNDVYSLSVADTSTGLGGSAGGAIGIIILVVVLVGAVCCFGYYMYSRPKKSNTTSWNSYKPKTRNDVEASMPLSPTVQQQFKFGQKQQQQMVVPSPPVNALPPNWEEVLDETSGEYYFWNKETNETTWDRPVAVVPPPRPPAQPKFQKPQRRTSLWKMSKQSNTAPLSAAPSKPKNVFSWENKKTINNKPWEKKKTANSKPWEKKNTVNNKPWEKKKTANSKPWSSRNNAKRTPKANSARPGLANQVGKTGSVKDRISMWNNKN